MSDDGDDGAYPISRRRIEELEALRYFYDNGVPQNIQGITDPEQYQQFEYREFLLQSRTRPHMETFDYGELQDVHRHLFGNVWSWAGETRSYTTGRNDPSFARPEFIEPEMNKLLSELNAENNLAGKSRDAFVERAAHYTNEINAIHPFVEGNGRVTRAFLEDLAVNDVRPNLPPVMGRVRFQNVALCGRCVQADMGHAPYRLFRRTRQAAHRRERNAACGDCSRASRLPARPWHATATRTASRSGIRPSADH